MNLNLWRPKDRNREEKKYFIYNHDLDTVLKAPFGVVTAFLDIPNPVSQIPNAAPQVLTQLWTNLNLLK